MGRYISYWSIVKVVTYIHTFSTVREFQKQLLSILSDS
jgi:hypothetical protein